MQDNPETILKDEESKQQADLLLEIITQLAKELHPHHRPPPLTLDSSLDREYGFDSLSRVELLLRIEQNYHVRLSEQLLAFAETPRELLRELQSSSNITSLSH